MERRENSLHVMILAALASIVTHVGAASPPPASSVEPVSAGGVLVSAVPESSGGLDEPPDDELQPISAAPAPTIEAAAYFVVSESLANVAKYARASAARVKLSRCDGTLRVEVLDDGIGGADPGRGSGLRGLDDRVSALRGSFCVETPAGGGTRVYAEIPCDA